VGAVSLYTPVVSFENATNSIQIAALKKRLFLSESANMKSRRGETHIRRLDTIILLVADIETSVGFYRDSLGLWLKFKSPGWAELVLGDTHIALHRKSKEMMESGVSLGAAGFSLNFEVSDLDATATTLSESGISPVGGIKSYDFGRYFFVIDPDGYLVGFREYKSEFTPQGSRK
jgi:catechol 2,3-dioxygenase-like lactoylglutathione lyase family enzyme